MVLIRGTVVPFDQTRSFVASNGNVSRPSFTFQSSSSTGLSNDNGTLKISSNGVGTVAVAPNLVTIAGNLAVGGNIVGGNVVVGAIAFPSSGYGVVACTDANGNLVQSNMVTDGTVLYANVNACVSTFSSKITVAGYDMSRGANASTTTNFAVGLDALANVTTGIRNIGVGQSALKSVVGGVDNIGAGYQTMMNANGIQNSAFGNYALRLASDSITCSAFGHSAMGLVQNSYYNNAFGAYALGSLNTGYGRNCAFGSMQNGVGATESSAFGFASLLVANGTCNSVLGAYAMNKSTSGGFNTVAGYETAYNLTTGGYNVGVGAYAMREANVASYNTAVGYQALRYAQDGSAFNFTNCAGLGYDARVSGNNQIQLGNVDTSTYVYGTVQNRSDARDKTDVRDTGLGLEFIENLRPVDFRWDYRDAYIEFEHVIDRFDVDAAPLPLPTQTEYDVLHEGVVVGSVRCTDGGAWESRVTCADAFREVPLVTCAAGPVRAVTVRRARAVEKDGSRKRERYHHGFIAQEVPDEFGGKQHHAVAGGLDVYSLGYEELLAPIVRAIQELSGKISSLS